MEYLKNLNDRQIEAVKTTNGPVLILAGAGSGKTTVLVNRIAYILNELRESPYRVLAITFTNKAANEMKERIKAKIGEVANTMWIGTFHSICIRILRSCIDTIGYGKNFVIYDSTDSVSVIRECMKELNIDDKKWTPKSVANIISRAKDEMITPEIFEAKYRKDFRMRIISEIYERYQDKLKKNNALDFDDIILNTVKVLSENPDIRENYGLRFRYIMVDEYQDTNNAQYMLISLLAREHRNLCVVGDDDQSIYKFRGANIRNILDFEKEFADAVTIRLEQNYRSTQNILNAANAIIANNKGRKGKKLWTDKGDGDKIVLYRSVNEHDEGEYIAQMIKKCVEEGKNYSDCAVLYRMNAQSRVIEEMLMRAGIPYRVLAGLRFYDRREIKDIMAYMRTVYNPGDDVSVKRIINVPKRGIGQTTVDKVSRIAENNGISFYEVIYNAEKYPELSKAAVKLKEFAKFIEHMYEINESKGLVELVNSILNDSGYMAMITEEDLREKTSKKENLEELVSVVTEFYDDDAFNGTLDEFLERTALISDVDNYDAEAESVVLMTIHSAKGLEFPVVFLPGMENGIFPGRNSMGDDEDIEEERRLCYVAVTRAKEKLFITNAECRMVYGQTTYSVPSIFVGEIPTEYIKGVTPPKPVRAAAAKLAEMKNIGMIAAFSDAELKIREPQSVFNKGDRVKHHKFGEGTVISAQQFGRDTKLEIIFDSGQKKILMAAFARLIRLD